MKQFTLKDAKDAHQILSDGNTVLALGKTLWIFRTDGRFVSHHKTIRHCIKAAILADNTAIVQDCKSYYHISLDDGSILWTSSAKKGINPGLRSFAVSPDRTTVYDLISIKGFLKRIDRICPDKQLHDYCTVQGTRAITDLYCPENDIIYLLDQRTDTQQLSGDIQGNQTITQIGVMRVVFNNDQPKVTWKVTQQYPHPCRLCAEKTDGKYVLCRDGTVIDMDTGNLTSLLSENDFSEYQHTGFFWFNGYDREQKLLSITYSRAWVENGDKTDAVVTEGKNLIVNCSSKKLVSLYNNSKQGCLIRNEFWLCTESGIIRKPFPQFD